MSQCLGVLIFFNSFFGIVLKKIILLQTNRDSIYKIYKDFYQKDNNNEKWIYTYLIDSHPINRNGGG